MLHFFAELPVALVAFFYGWSLAVKYGPVLGIHIFILAISFFYLCTPLVSYLYVAGLLPVRRNSSRSGFGWIVLWVFLLLFNIVTFLYIPSLFRRTPITTLVAYIASNPGTRYSLIPLSGLGLLYHWAVRHLSSSKIRFLGHLLGIVTSAFIFSNI